MRKTKKYLTVSIILLSIGLLGLVINSSIIYSRSVSDEVFGLKSLSFQEVKERAENYLKRYGYEDLKIKEIMEFSNNFYIEVIEEQTGIGAMELLLDKRSGFIFPEYGPNMMWNLKYGMHRRIDITKKDINMPIVENSAKKIAEKYLSKKSSGEYVGDEVEKFYGYYTIHTTTKDGEISGMLSINGFTGQAWYHNWHGIFIDMKEY